jgi:hypothetical protein
MRRSLGMRHHAIERCGVRVGDNAVHLRDASRSACGGVHGGRQETHLAQVCAQVVLGDVALNLSGVNYWHSQNLRHKCDALHGQLHARAACSMVCVSVSCFLCCSPCKQQPHWAGAGLFRGGKWREVVEGGAAAALKMRHSWRWSKMGAGRTKTATRVPVRRSCRAMIGAAR